MIPTAWAAIGSQLELWHGCLLPQAESIRRRGVDLTFSRCNLDFGRGFYTTTIRRQAERWARIRYNDLSVRDRTSGNRPTLVKFLLGAVDLASLHHLSFCRGDPEHERFWSLVHYCRTSRTDVAHTHLHPQRAKPDDWYDLVCGPLAKVWPPVGRQAIADSDQFSFHTREGVAILNAVKDGGSPGFEVIVM